MQILLYLLNLQLKENSWEKQGMQWKNRQSPLCVCRALIKRMNDISIPP